MTNNKTNCMILTKITDVFQTYIQVKTNSNNEEIFSSKEYKLMMTTNILLDSR